MPLATTAILRYMHKAKWWQAMDCLMWISRSRWGALVSAINQLLAGQKAAAQQQEKLMSEVDDLNNALTDLQTQVAAIGGAVTTAVNDLDALEAQVAGIATNPDPAAIESAVTTIKNLSASLTQTNAALTAAHAAIGAAAVPASVPPVPNPNDPGAGDQPSGG